MKQIINTPEDNVFDPSRAERLKLALHPHSCQPIMARHINTSCLLKDGLLQYITQELLSSAIKSPNPDVIRHGWQTSAVGSTRISRYLLCG